MNELHRNILPLIANKVEEMKKHIQADVGMKLTATDAVVKESIKNICTSYVSLI